MPPNRNSGGGVPAPAVLQHGYGLRVIDYTDVELEGAADATGLAWLQTSPLAWNYYMRVERMTIVPYGTNSVNECEIGVYVGDQLIPQRGRDWTPFPAGTVAVSEYPSYLTVRPTYQLSIAISGAAPGDIFFAAVQYQLVEKVLGQANWPSS